MKILKDDREKILEVLDDLPPQNPIYRYTEDQVTYYFEVREKFDVMHDFFEAYFQGRAIPIDRLEGKTREFYLTKFDSFLAFYNLIQWGWKYILEESETPAVIHFNFNNPGDCFVEFLRKQAEAQIHMCKLGRYDIRPRHKCEMRRVAEKIREGKATAIQKSNFQKYIKSLENLGFRKFAELEIFCVTACKKHTKKNSALQEKLEDYYNKFEKVEHVTQSIDRNRPAYAWENGKRLKSVKEGGTYV